MGENFMLGQILKKLVKKKGEVCTMDGRRHWKPSGSNWKLRWVMDSKHNKCAPIVSGDNKCGYGVVHDVQIERFDCIPSTIELAGKTLKMDYKQEAHNNGH
jgi:hypothetical protein